MVAQRNGSWSRGDFGEPHILSAKSLTAIARLLYGSSGGEHLLGARPHAYVLGEIYPAHSAGTIN